MLDFAASAFTALFVTIDPLALTPVFLALTAGMTKAQRRQVALRTTVISFVILTAFAFAGPVLLDVFGITMPAFRIAGGLLLFAIAFDMLFERRHKRKARGAGKAASGEDVGRIAVFPLAIPLLAGPGAISASILTAEQAPSLAHKVVLITLITAILVIAWLIFSYAERLERIYGAMGRIVITRLLGLILAALAVQFVTDGVFAFIQNPPA